MEPRFEKEKFEPLNEEETKELKLLEGPKIEDVESHKIFHEWVVSNVSVQDRRVMLWRMKELQKRKGAELKSITGPKPETVESLEQYFTQQEKAREVWMNMSQVEREKAEERLHKLTKEELSFNFRENEAEAISVKELKEYFRKLSKLKDELPETIWKSPHFPC